MSIFKKKIRPSGNQVILKRNHSNENIFDGFESQFYQSGTSSLAAAIIASIKIKSNSTIKPEVIVPAYCCPDIVSAIIYAKATPVLIDLEPDTPWMSLSEIEDNITDNTVAIIAVKFLGINERINSLSKICTKNNIILIEDSAQGFPVKDAEKYWLGDMIIISFGRGKPVSLLEGGAVLTKQLNLFTLPTPSGANNKLTDSLKYWLKARIYNFLINPYVYKIFTSLPGITLGQTVFKKLDKLHGMNKAALEQLSNNINEYTHKTNQTANINEMLNTIQSPILINLAQTTKHDMDIPLLRHPILIKNDKLRNKISTELDAFGISTMYKVTVDKIDGVENVIQKSCIKKNATNFSNFLITLPTHDDVNCNDIKHIREIIFKNLLSINSKTKTTY